MRRAPTASRTTRSRTNSFKVVAHSPADSAITAEAVGSFTNGAAVVNLTLPIGVATGTVFYADGLTPAPFAIVTLAQQSSGGDATQLQAYADEAGRFSVTGVALGAFEIQASDADGMLLGLASGSNGSITTALVANVRLRPSGTVTGIVRDSAGEPAGVESGGDHQRWRSAWHTTGTR